MSILSRVSIGVLSGTTLAPSTLPSLSPTAIFSSLAPTGGVYGLKFDAVAQGSGGQASAEEGKLS